MSAVPETHGAPALKVVPAGQPAPRGGPPKRVLVVAAIVLAAALAAGARLYWAAQHFAETDNAFVAGHVHPVSARIAGVVTRVQVQDNASVRSGEPLVVLDGADQQVQIERLQAQIAQARAQLSGTAVQVTQARSQTAAAQAQVAQAQANLARAELDAERARQLSSGDAPFISKQSLDAALIARDAAAAELQARRASATATGEQVNSGQSAREAAQAQIGALEAQLKDARQQMAYMTVAAPAEGRIGKRTVEVGQRVSAGQQLLAVVDGRVWITANFKETQLAKMKVGQLATVKLDAFPGREFRARVDSFAPASGAQFALLPPDNATGNYTKIVQRVPVKLVFDEAEIAPLKGRLVPGLSAVVTVDLR